ncbi:unhealthy ribosome biogenesis protein 2 homolog [Rhinophrynus dorsalis]
MAAIYSGIHLKLQSSKISWKDKIKLAQFTWISHQCVLPNKEQVLLDWVSHTLVGNYTKKINLEADIEQKLWGFLDSILHSKTLQNLLKKGKSVNLHFTIAQAINDFIASSSTLRRPQPGISTVLSCCQGILSSPVLSLVYTSKCELIVNLISKLSTLACHYLASEEQITHQVLDVLQMSFNHYIVIQRQQINPNRVFLQLMEQLFQPCLLLRHYLNIHSLGKEDGSGLCPHLNKNIQNKVEAIFGIGLFQSELFSSYKEELLPARDQLEKKKGCVKVILRPVDTLVKKLTDCNFCEAEICTSVVSSSVPLIYKLFIDSYCRDGNQLVCFHMMVRMFECLQTSVLQELSDLTLPSNWALGLFALDQLLNFVLDNEIYNIAVDRIRHREVQLHFFHKLAKLLVHNACTSVPAWFRCLKSLTMLNHLIVEPFLGELISCAWTDTNFSDVKLKKAQEMLIYSLLQTYSKLRQFPKLFGDILMVMCQPAIGILKWPVLYSGLTELVVDFLHELPPNQIFDTCALIIEKCHAVLLPGIKDNLDTSLTFFSLSSFLHCLLFNMKSMENNTPLPVVIRFRNLMNKVIDHLIKPSVNLVKDNCTATGTTVGLQKLCDATLLLIYTWVEVNTLTALTCNKYTTQLNKLSITSQLPAEASEISPVLHDKTFWERVQMLTTETHSVSKYCLGLISIQKVKFLLMQTRVLTENELLNICAAASFVLHLGHNVSAYKDKEFWNGSANTVNTNCFRIAYWHLVISNLSIIHPYLSAKDTSNVADCLLESLCSQDKNQTDQKKPLTVENISSSLLHSDIFPEMKLLQCSFITSIIKKCATILQNYNKGFSEILEILSDESQIWHKHVFPNRETQQNHDTFKGYTSNDLSVCWKSIENAAQNLMLETRSGSCLNLTNSDLTYLVAVIELISVLKPDSLTPSDHSRCFILLLSLARADLSHNALYLTSNCYRILTYLLCGKNSNAVIKLLYASDILDIVMSPLLKSNWVLHESERKQEWTGFVKIFQSFLESFLRMIVEKNQSILLNLEKFSAFLFSYVPHLDTIGWNSCVGYLTLVSINTLCHVITQLLQNELASKLRTVVFSYLLQQTVEKMGIVVSLCLNDRDISQNFPSFLVTCMTTLLEAELCQLSFSHIAKEDIGSIYPVQLHNVKLYKHICSQIMREVCYAEGQTLFLKSALHYLTRFIKVEASSSQERTVIAIFCSLKKMLIAPWITVLIIKSIEEELTELFQQMAWNCSFEDFYTIMKLGLQWLEVSNLWKNNYQEPFAGITLIRILLNCKLNGEHRKLFWFTAPQIITTLVMLTKEACRERVLLSRIVIPVLETIAQLLRQGEELFTNPYHLTLAFSLLLTVPLDHLKAEEYYSVFRGVHEVLFSLLQCHSQAILKAVPSFLNSFQRLVTSIMHEGRQKGETGAIPDSEVVLKCAQLVKRMYTHIAAKTEEFTVFSAFIVSQYVNELQKVTLNSAVKKHLNEGIFHILDLCIDRDIKFLNTSLHTGVQEVFKELYNEYSYNNKTKNHGDKKYTA